MITFIRLDAEKAKELEAFKPKNGRYVSKDYLPIYDCETLLRIVPASAYEALKAELEILKQE